MVADFQVDCYDTEHLALEAFAVIMVFAFPIGVPCALFLVLFVNRRELNKDASKRRELFSPLVDTYRIELWWCPDNLYRLFSPRYLVQRPGVRLFFGGACFAEIF